MLSLLSPTRRQPVIPPWPAGVPKLFTKIGELPRPHSRRGLASLSPRARRGTFYTGTTQELMFTNLSDFTAFNTSASEGSLLSGVDDQPFIPAGAFYNRLGKGRTIKLYAAGVLGTTGTPTITFQWRMGTTQGSDDLTGASIGVSVAITCGNGVTNQWWESWLDIQCYTPGLGTDNTILSCAGAVSCPGGFASPFAYALLPTTPPTATWTQTCDAAFSQYINLSVTWSASHASNTVTCKKLQMAGLN